MREGGRLPLVKHRLDPVAVEVAHEGRVVALAELRPKARGPFVTAARRYGRRVERVDRLAGRRSEREVEPRPRSMCLVPRGEERELFVSISWASVADGALVRQDPDVAERGEHAVVEGSGTGEVRDPQGEMVDHRGHPTPVAARCVLPTPKTGAAEHR